MKERINSTESITLYDLMAEDIDVWITRDKKFGFRLDLDNEDGSELLREDGIHPFAVEGMADFCRRYLTAFERASKLEAA